MKKVWKGFAAAVSAAAIVLRAARRRQAQRHARQWRRVRASHAAARRIGHGHVLRRPVLQLAAGKQREPQWHDPPLPAQTLHKRDGHGTGGAGDCRRDQQPAHARARLPHTR